MRSANLLLAIASVGLTLFANDANAAHFTREMDRMWRGAELGVTTRMHRKIKRQTRKCGSGVERD